ncbi:hypothetical protein BAUCODRAFT_148908 [Baudoinia panamericana UAMH 10762]|uniref:F-box domain-containing protein n=1 Tax=Baudoinia panamericana (strain UAMH 10762) TaxID=717646 RepID=M2NAB9_BAUPA|nr:uncharacterized protein BAUCODRAFT_148908 [Baudoinia panamericana UAMH 10762]EMC96074.1 hypothetical protein BAUCODRAFT_148908 [Baudoinia panamericana UAMH 10762]
MPSRRAANSQKATTGLSGTFRLLALPDELVIRVLEYAASTDQPNARVNLGWTAENDGTATCILLDRITSPALARVNRLLRREYLKTFFTRNLFRVKVLALHEDLPPNQILPLERYTNTIPQPVWSWFHHLEREGIHIEFPHLRFQILRLCEDPTHSISTSTSTVLAAATLDWQPNTGEFHLSFHDGWWTGTERLAILACKYRLQMMVQEFLGLYCKSERGPLEWMAVQRLARVWCTGPGDELRMLLDEAMEKEGEE